MPLASVLNIHGPACGHSHLVEFYDTEEFLVDTVRAFLLPALRDGDAAIVVATAAHRQAFETALAKAGIDVDGAVRDGRYLAFDAAELLSRFMVAGEPDARLFRETVGAVVERASRDGRHVRAYGEMVALLCEDGAVDAALALEDLWNALSDDYPFELLCAYPMAMFDVEASAAAFERICELHTGVIPSEGYSLLTDPVARARAIAQMQQVMAALSNDKEVSRHNGLILNAVGEGIFGVAADGTVAFANAAAACMTGYSPAEMLGRGLHGLVHYKKADGSAYPLEECAMYAALMSGTVDRCNQHDVFWRKDGTGFPVEFTSTSIIDGAHAGGAAVVFRDITQRREIERLKEQFVSVVSHELRTPLTAIRGSLGLLESGALGPLPEEGRRMLEIAVRNTDRLVRLVNDMLDLERADSGTMALRYGPCDAAQLVAQAAESVLAMAGDAGVRLSVDAPPASFAADADRLVQTLINLIHNAVKYSPAGATVEVRSRRRDGEILFEVRDHGRGIPADKLETVFERFGQVDQSDSREKGGTGLGLAICRSNVHHHGGRIWATSVLDEGSTFSFVVPRQAASASSRAGGGLFSANAGGQISR